MAQRYSDSSRENDPHALPNIETFQLTAEEVALQDEDTVHEFMKRHEFRLASMNSKVRQKMIEAIIEENGIKGGWFYWYCLPGCLPDSEPNGPYDSEALATKAAQDEHGEEE